MISPPPLNLGFQAICERKIFCEDKKIIIIKKEIIVHLKNEDKKNK